MDLDPCRGDHPVHFILAGDLGLSFGAVVWITRLLVGLLVCIKNQTRALRDFYSSDRAAAKRNVPSVPTTVRCARF